MTEWKPIKTHKFGTPDSRKACLVWEPKYRNIYSAFQDFDGEWRFFGGGLIMPYKPTHWMPLPEPPKENQDE